MGFSSDTLRGMPAVRSAAQGVLEDAGAATVLSTALPRFLRHRLTGGGAVGRWAGSESSTGSRPSGQSSSFAIGPRRAIFEETLRVLRSEQGP